MAHTTLIAVEQHGYAVFGVGETVQQAKADAAQWLDHDAREALADVTWNARPNDGEMRLARVTPALATAVHARGGMLAYGQLADGTLCTEDEADPA